MSTDRQPATGDRMIVNKSRGDSAYAGEIGTVEQVGALGILLRIEGGALFFLRRELRFADDLPGDAQ